MKLVGDQVDLTSLPDPLLNKAAGGSYIQTLGINIVPHPTEKPHHEATARCTHLRATGGSWQNVPYAIALGAPPIATMAANMPLPAGVSEAEYVGALCGSPLELVKYEGNDIYVPASSEIVFEGTVSITDRGEEGPFGEMHGYSFLDKGSLQPLYAVNAITHRRDPILPFCVPGRATGPDETHTMIGTLASAEIRELLQDHSFPVKQVFALYESQVTRAAVQVDGQQLARFNTNARDLCTRIGELVFHHKCGMQIHRLLVVGDDIDPFRFEDVMWAYATRCRPNVGDFFFDGEDVPAYSLVPYMSHGRGGMSKVRGGKAVSNCLLPHEYEGKQMWVTCDFDHGYPDEIKEKVKRRWNSMGLCTCLDVAVP